MGYIKIDSNLFIAMTVAIIIAIAFIVGAVGISAHNTNLGHSKKEIQTMRQQIFTLQQQMTSRTNTIKKLGLEHNFEVDFIAE